MGFSIAMFDYQRVMGISKFMSGSVWDGVWESRSGDGAKSAGHALTCHESAKWLHAQDRKWVP